MYAKPFEEGEPFRCVGNDYVMLLPRDLTESCEVVLQKVKPGGSTPPNAHETFLQVYLIVKGEAEVFIGEEMRRLTAPAIVLVPKQKTHWVKNTSQTAELDYLYISVWPDGIPLPEREGGWKNVYAGIIQTYADRGYGPTDPAPEGENS